MSDVVPVIILLLILATQIPALTFGIQRLYTAKRLNGDDPMDISTARQEGNQTVEVVGTAEVLEETTQSKYSENECFAYSWQRSSSGSDGGVKGHGTEGKPFLVRDETGEIAVDPANAQIAGNKEAFNDQSNDKLTEWRIEAGDQVHVYGPVQSLVEGRRGFGTETVYIGSNSATQSKVEQIRSRPLAAYGILLGLARDLYITNGDESDAVKKVGLLGLVFTIFAIGGIAAGGFVAFAFFG